MHPAKIEKLAEMAEHSASRIAREIITFVCQAFSIFKEDFISSQPEKVLSQTINEREGNKSVTLPIPNIYTAEQLAELLQVKLKTIYSWANTEKIPSLKVGSCLRFDLEKVLEAVQNTSQLSLPETKPTLKETKLFRVK